MSFVGFHYVMLQFLLLISTKICRFSYFKRLLFTSVIWLGSLQLLPVLWTVWLTTLDPLVPKPLMLLMLYWMVRDSFAWWWVLGFFDFSTSFWNICGLSSLMMKWVQEVMPFFLGLRLWEDCILLRLFLLLEKFVLRYVFPLVSC